MTTIRAVRPAVSLAVSLGVVPVLLLALTGCAQRAAGTPSPSAAGPAVRLPDDPGALVLRAEFVGGYVAPGTDLARLPLASVYSDGRVLVEGPVAAVHPGPAWPDVQVVDAGRDRVQELADLALAAGVAETTDLGTPPLADVPSTRFTLVTADGVHVREVHALVDTAGMPGSGLTGAQQAAREELLGLLDELSGIAAGGAGGQAPRAWEPVALAALVRPWSAADEDAAQGLPPEPVPWPGPALPGEPVGPLPELTCVTATGAEATAVAGAARNADSLTPWSTADGSRWWVTFRPLLPDEDGCADLID